jgi:hypothetical protein
MRRYPGGVVLAVLVVLVLALASHAEALSTADLADDWRVTFVASPTFAFGSTAVRTYQGDMTFSAAGVASGTLTLGDLAPGTVAFTVSGSAALSGQGLVTGSLTLTGPDTRSLVIPEARVLGNRHTIVGVATLNRGGLRDTGFITLVRLTDQTFSRTGDLAATWNYYEITPSNALKAGDADWTQGKIDFHGDGCTVATLFFADGTVRAQPVPGNPTSFG